VTRHLFGKGQGEISFPGGRRSHEEKNRFFIIVGQLWHLAILVDAWFIATDKKQPMCFSHIVYTWFFFIQ
jgi:hypothetical protein